LRTEKGPVVSFARGVTWTAGKFTGTAKLGRYPTYENLVFGDESFYPKSPLATQIIRDIVGEEGQKIDFVLKLQSTGSGMQAKRIAPVMAEVFGKA
ncbi:MAG: hypothetical protein MUF06_22980, partial [Pirellulaceae bacterium]|nr:hypothetical protein [Pirellulaceae bacterium]